MEAAPDLTSAEQLRVQRLHDCELNEDEDALAVFADIAAEAEARRCMININQGAGELIAQMTAAHDQKKFLELDEKATQLLMKLDKMELLTIPDLFHMRKDVVSRLQTCSTDNAHRLKTCTNKTVAAATTTTKTTTTTANLIAVRAPT